MPEPTALVPYVEVLWVFLGILISIVLPVAVKTLTAATPEGVANSPSLSEKIKDAWNKYGGNKYVLILLAALLVAVVIVFLLDLKFYAIRDAILAGFAWESFVNKLFAKQHS